MTKKLILQIEVAKVDDSSVLFTEEAVEVINNDKCVKKAVQEGKTISIETPIVTEYSHIFPVYAIDDSPEPAKWAPGLNLPTEDEVYEEALLGRAKNMASKLQRINREIRNEARELVEKSKEAMRTKMELNVLLEELGEEKTGVVDHVAGFYEENLATEVDTAALELNLTGSDLLKAYAQLKAVFDIDNERPERKDIIIEKSDTGASVKYVSKDQWKNASE